MRGKPPTGELYSRYSTHKSPPAPYPLPLRKRQIKSNLFQTFNIFFDIFCNSKVENTPKEIISINKKANSNSLEMSYAF